jgi:hypothetical protein
VLVDPTRPFRPRPCDRLQFNQVGRFERDFDHPPRCCHCTRRHACVAVRLQHMGPPWESGTTGRFHESMY